MKPPIAIVHFGVQHSHELARALHQGGMLSCFVTSVNGAAAWVPEWLRESLRSRKIDGIPGSLVTTIPYLEALIAVANPLLGPRIRSRLIYAGLALFDRLASARALASNPRVVVGYENNCRHTFRRAKAAGALCVLDAASIHHSAQSVRPDDADAGFRARIDEGKDEEIRLADHIVVLSTYARDTYAAAGVSIERITVIPPGVRQLDAVRAPPQESRSGIHFLFVGNVKYAKGIDLLLQAFERFDVPEKRLTIVGSNEEPEFLAKALPGGVEYLGKLGREALAEAYARADVLVSPSRADGFGFVVAEAMSAGLPVIVSSATGAKDLVTEGATGWIFPAGNEIALLDAMKLAAGRKHDLRTMGAHGRQTVAGLTWDAYGERIRTLFRRLLEASPS